eukprot:11361448-Karenia_brevis.AAC.1
MRQACNDAEVIVADDKNPGEVWIGKSKEIGLALLDQVLADKNWTHMPQTTPAFLKNCSIAIGVLALPSWARKVSMDLAST